jgi:hypothetical protein
VQKRRAPGGCGEYIFTVALSVHGPSVWSLILENFCTLAISGRRDPKIRRATVSFVMSVKTHILVQ